MKTGKKLWIGFVLRWLVFDWQAFIKKSVTIKIDYSLNFKYYDYSSK